MKGGVKMKEKLNYEEDVKIDPDALDVAWLNQATLMKKYGKHQAATRKEMDNLKEKVDVIKAKADIRIRTDPESYEIKKVTESIVQSTVLLEEDYQEILKEYANARYENDVAIAVVRAIEHRKTALENLVRLLGSQYFAGPKTPRDLSYETLKKTERKENNQKVKITARRERTK